MSSKYDNVMRLLRLIIIKAMWNWSR